VGEGLGLPELDSESLAVSEDELEHDVEGILEPAHDSDALLDAAVEAIWRGI
jgi:hypothetical protein